MIDPFPNSERVAFTTAVVTIKLADINPNWPYNFVGWDEWEAENRDIIDEKLESGRDNYYGYEIWNATWKLYRIAAGKYTQVKRMTLIK